MKAMFTAGQLLRLLNTLAFKTPTPIKQWQEVVSCEAMSNNPLLWAYTSE